MIHASRRKQRTPLAMTMAGAALTLSLSAHAQWGGLLQSMMQMQDSATTAPQQTDTAPAEKRWGTPKPVPDALQQQATVFAARTPEADLRALYERLYIEGERNATLNHERIGLAALAMGRLDLAEQAFDAAILRIDQIYADNAEARKAKSLWSAEKVKDYKGEPYERAMAYFYRGLVYAARSDFQNARAMFKQADYQDTVAETEQYAGDFGLMPYMAGWASYCDGNPDLAKDYLQMAAKASPNLRSMSVEQPVLVLFETGRAPFKYGAGKHGEALKWQAHSLPRQTIQAICTAEDSQCLPGHIVQGADLGYQATTRGGRPIDAVLDGKASFKEGAQGVADAATAISAVGLDVAMQTGNRDAAGLGLISMFAGLVAQGVAAATQAQADIREWEQLPETIWLATGPTPLKGSLTAQAQTADGKAQPFALARLVHTPSCQLYWGRSASPVKSMADAGPMEPGDHALDPALRQALDALQFQEQPSAAPSHAGPGDDGAPPAPPQSATAPVAAASPAGKI